MLPSTGTTLECLRHYASTSGQPHASLQRLAELAAVGIDAARDWMSGRRPPIGFHVLALRVFLEREGYAVTEFRALNPTVREIVARLVQGSVTLEQLCGATGFCRAHMLKVLHGTKRCRPGTAAKLRAALGQKGEAPPVARPPVRSSSAVSASANGSPLDREAVLTVVANQIRALHPLTTFLLSEAFSAEERHQLRRLVGGDGVFRLSNNLIRLCSEKARDEFDKRKE